MDHLDLSDEISSGVVVIAIMLAGSVIVLAAAIWLALWAVNKPVHPTACANYRAECAAAVEEAK